MPAYTDTTAYPAFATKKQLLRFILEYVQPNCAVVEDLLYRLNNTDTTGLADGATVFNPANSFASA